MNRHLPLIAVGMCTIAALATTVVAQSPPPTATPAPVVDQHGPTIKDAYAKSFTIGMAGDIPANYSDVELALIKDNFTFVTPENCMKPASVHPEEDTWRFERPDALVKWCEENHIAVHGHTLVWHAQTGNWFFAGQDRAKVTQRLRDHITTLVGRYKGRIRSWDVVNEQIGDDGKYRDTTWVRGIGDGDELMRLAFGNAARYAPDTELYYNDFNAWRPAKVAGIVRMVKMLKAHGVRIDGVGMQGHWGLDYPSLDDIKAAIDAYAAAGVKVSIT